jgi:hypothetical protein
MATRSSIMLDGRLSLSEVQVQAACMVLSRCTCGCIGTEVVPHGLWVIVVPWLAGRACQNTRPPLPH